MVIAPELHVMQSISQIMASTLQELHKFIEEECNHNNPKETLVLMMSFTSGLIIQLRDKMETLEQGLGSQFLDAVNKTTQKGSEGLETIERLNRNDPSLKKSSSNIDPNDLPAAIGFLGSKLMNDIKAHMDELPYVLGNDMTLSHALAALIANIFTHLDDKNVDALIDAFSKNIRVFANKAEKNNNPKYN